LIESVTAWAAATGATALMPDVVAGNTAAIALYRQAGFVPYDGEATDKCAPGKIRFVRSLATTLE